jgi:hypothetical protein
LQALSQARSKPIVTAQQKSVKVTVTKPDFRFPPYRPMGEHCAGIEPHFSKTYIRKTVVEERPSFGPCGDTLSPRTGFRQLDEMLKGMNKGSLIVIAGSCGAGKTLLVNQIFKSVIQHDDNCAFKTNNLYVNLEDALKHSSGRKHLVVYDELSIHRTGHEFRDLRTEIQKNIDWAIVTMQSQRERKPYDGTGIGIPMSPLYAANYVFHIRKIRENNSLGFKVKCVKNRCRENGQEFFLKLENRPFLKEV